MTNRIASFRGFLKTGVLGPLSTDMKLIEVAKVLGAPQFFFLHYDTKDVPDYWGYNKLEISFAPDQPHEMKWFQIEHAGGLEGEFDVITDTLMLALEGFDGDTRPSAFLAGDLWNLENVRVNIGALGGDVMLNISAGKVTVIFDVASDFIPDENAENYIATTEISRIVSDIDGRTNLNSIYAFPSAEEAAQSDTYGHPIQLTGRDYLQMISAPSKT
jgi:hypothetical protein